MNLALFDFDGTITIKGTYPGFVSFAVRRRRKVVGGLILSPMLVGYQSRLVSDRAIRKAMSRIAFWGEEPDRLRRLGQRYAVEVLPHLIRPVALQESSGIRHEEIWSSWFLPLWTSTSSPGAGTWPST